MRKTNLYLLGAMISLSFAACNGTQNGAGHTDSTTTTTQMNPGDSAVTTTTTTTVAHHRYSGTFVPQPNVKYIDLRTRKEVTVKIDTEKGEVVNSETNEPMDLFVMPITHDTIYGQTGTVVNNYIIKDESGSYSVDTSKINLPATTGNESTRPDGKYKEKENASGSKTKIKTEDYKVKDKNGVEKVKDR